MIAKEGPDRQRRFLGVIGEAIHKREAALLGVCLIAAIVAQYLLDKTESLALAGALYLGAAIAFVLIYHEQSMEASERGSVSEETRVRWGWVALAGLCGLLAFPRFKGNLYSGAGTLWWVTGLICLGIASWRGGSPRLLLRRSAEEPTPCQGLTVTWAQVALLGIMLVGAFFRFHKIDTIPLEMGCDLPHIYNNIRLVLRKEFLVFFPSYPGREGLFFYLAAPFCRLFGLNHTTIKMSSALVGVSTIPVVYLLGKELYDRQVGLYAAFFLSVSHWHVILTRVGFRACTVPLMVSLVWYFMVRGLKMQRTWFFALSGFFVGVGLYSYNSFMIVPLMVVLILLTSFLVGRGRVLLKNWSNVLILVLVAVYVFIPLGRYAFEDPKTYFYRAATRITGLEVALPGDILMTLVTNVRKALLMFNYRGDGVFIANVPDMRELGFFSAALFVLGLAYVVWRWRRGHNASVLISLLVMLLPTIFSLAFPHEVPNAIRAIGALPAAVILPAVALGMTTRRFAALYPYDGTRETGITVTVDGVSKWAWRWHSARLWRYALGGLLAAALVAETWMLYPTYFDAYLAHLPNHNYSISLAMAQAIDDFSDDGESYIKVAPYWYDGNAVRTQLQREDQSWHNELIVLNADQPPLRGELGKFMVIVHPQDAEAQQLLQQAFPSGLALTHLDNDGRVAFITFYGREYAAHGER
jgi:hypothetical protein